MKINQATIDDADILAGLWSELHGQLLCFVFPVLSYADQLEEAKTTIQNRDFEKAFELLGPLAEENHAGAQSLLGSPYINGQAVEKDDTKGLSWIMKAARQGYVQGVRIYFLLLDDS